MNDDFPKLNPGQVALRKVDAQTGVVLDVSGSWDISETNKYWVFDSWDQAKKYAIQKYESDQSVEFIIYDENRNFVFGMPE